MKTTSVNNPQTSRIVAAVLSVWLSVAVFGGVDTAMVANEQSAMQHAAQLHLDAPIQQLDTITVLAKRL